MTTFVTHPSVRIRGTENNYNPSQCLDPNCNNKSPHMHCPFCIKTECYLDPVILKAHYRVKHVDKGLDFAGLKILRCCDHCDIVGAIKGEKKFKGAHWHCYKCKNGFNRRDEAIKHYKTHFRNPQTTFQIQITQEVNQSSQLYESQEATHIISQDSLAAATTTIHPVLTEAIMTAASSNNSMNNENDSSLANGKGEGEVSVTVAANETVASTEGHAIMIIHEEQLENAHDVESNTFSATLTNNEGLQITSLLDVKMQLENRLVELQHQNQQLQIEKSQTEQQLQKEVEQLKLQIQMQANEINSLQKRQRELLEQLTIPVDDHLRQMLTNMQAQHQELLHQQLAQLKRNCLQKTHLFTQGNIALQVTSQPLSSMTGDSVVVTSPDNNGHLIPIPLQLMTDASVLVGNSENISASNNVSKDNPSRSLKRTSDDSNPNSRKRSKL